MSKVFGTVLSVLLMLVLASFLGCEGDQGPQGPDGDPGEQGPPGEPGESAPPSDTYFGLAIANASDYDLNGAFKVKLTFDSEASPSESVVVGYKLDKPPVLDGEDKGVEDWGTDELSVSEIALQNLRGANSQILEASIRAGYDEKYIYFMVLWREKDADPFIRTANWNPQRWRYTQLGNSWNQQQQEDQFYMFWDVTGVSGWTTSGAEVLFHDGDSTFYLDQPGLVDTWHWMAGRTGRAGFLDDRYVNEEGLQVDQGIGAYIANVYNNGPKWMHREDPNFNAELPLDLWNTTPFNPQAGWDDDATIPGYVSILPMGSRGDIECCRNAWARKDADTWVIEFRRLRNTGQGDDYQF